MGHSGVKAKLHSPALLRVVITGCCAGPAPGPQGTDQINTKRPLTSTDVLEDVHKPWMEMTLRSPLSFP